MVEDDPLKTQRDFNAQVIHELSAAGFEDATEVGRGGFGVVYRCLQPELDRTVAIKVLTAGLDDENKARFVREQRAMGRMTGHPNIVGVLHVGATSSGLPFIVMQYHSRSSLELRIRDGGPLPLDEVLHLGVRMAGALETAHRAGILHRDVKPGNIMITDYGEPALTDFGIARLSGAFETATGTVAGSAAFTAPEVLRGESPSVASDIYGLGATLFCVLTGHAAFERRTGEQVIAQFLRITTEPVPSLRDEGVPESVSAAIETLMAGDPDNRPKSAAEAGEVLRGLQSNCGFAPSDMALPASAGKSDSPQSGPRSGTPAYPGQRMLRLPGATGNLPLELTSFVGRRNELTETKRLLAVSRLVTLTGIGGVGKTRLALKVATSVKRDFKDGAWLIELNELRSGSLLVEVVAGTLGLREDSARPLKERVAEFLAARSVLLVMDNCEQIVDEVAKLVVALLQTCPNLRILATSREPLAVKGEAVMRIPPLPVPDTGREAAVEGLPQYDAVALFVERGASAVPDFELTRDNQAAVVSICQRLDGLPLPIELAAARLRAMSPEQILQRLTNRYTLLNRGSRGAATRQQTLRLCIDWSFELCTPQEQQVWSRLSVFAGTFEMDAASEICDNGLGAESILDIVTSLIDKSILIREDAGAIVRFRLLETLREYGREKAQQVNEYEDLRRRHANWYLQLALTAESEWISERQLEWIDRFEREQANLREALEFCASNNPVAGLRIATSLCLFWGVRGLYSEGRRWLEELLATPTSGPPVLAHVKGVYFSCMFAGLQKDLTAVDTLVESGRSLVEEGSESPSAAFMTHAEGVSAFFHGDLVRACSLFEQSHDRFRAQGNTTMQVDALWIMGLPYDLLGNTERSISCYEQVLAITELRGEYIYRSISMWAMAVLLWRQGTFDRAKALLEQGLVGLARSVGDPQGSAMCLEVLAWIAGSEGDAERAAILLGAAAAIGEAVGSPPTFLPDLDVYHVECEQRSRRKLGEKDFGTARRKGAELGHTGAVAYVLGEQSPETVPRDLDGTLTKREQQVAELVAEGLTNKAIAARLVISPRTAQGHVEHILVKLGFNSRAQISAWVVENRNIKRD